MAEDIDKKFEKLSQKAAREIDNGGTRPPRRKTAPKKAVKRPKKK